MRSPHVATTKLTLEELDVLFTAAVEYEVVLEDAAEETDERIDDSIAKKQAALKSGTRKLALAIKKIEMAEVDGRERR